jgi:hypothetical protein
MSLTPLATDHQSSPEALDEMAMAATATMILIN